MEGNYKSNKHALINSIGKLGFDIFHKSAGNIAASNMIISPYSISTLLLLICNGADCHTRDEIAAVCGLVNNDINIINEESRRLYALLKESETNVKFLASNSIWHQKEWHIKPEYINVCNNLYHAEIAEADFASQSFVDAVNAWSAHCTEGVFPEIISEPLDDSVVMMLINFGYFMGPWRSRFSDKLTKQGDFILCSGEKVPCKIMTNTNFYGYYENDVIQMVRIYYGKNSKYSMVIILPRPDRDINTFLLSMNMNQWRSLTGKPKNEWVALSLPGFGFEYEVNLQDILTDLGISSAFDTSADFSRISSLKPLFISQILHKTFINIDEKGTVAAAGLFARVMMGEPSGSVIDMKIDRPFIFAVDEIESGAILFLGKVMDPRPERGFVMPKLKEIMKREPGRHGQRLSDLLG